MSSLKSRMMLQSPANRSAHETGREPRCAPSVARVLHYGSCLDPGVAAKAPPLGTVTSSTSVAEQPPSRGTEPRRWRTAGPDPLGSLVPGARHPLRAAADGVPEAEPRRPDAPFHFLRIDEIAHGQVVSPRDRVGQAIASPDDLRRRGLHQHVLAVDRQQLAPAPMPSTASRARPAPPIVTSNTALNSPVAYVPAVVGYGVGTAASAAAPLGRSGSPAWPVWPRTSRCAGAAIRLTRGAARCCSWCRCCRRR